MPTNETIKIRLEARQKALSAAYEAYQQLLSGQVKSYTIGSRTLTHHNLGELEETISKLEKEVDELENMKAGGRRRRAVGVVPRDL